MTYLHLEKLTLNQFRSYPALDATFPPGATLILGENGAGKSNILEAIYMLATSKSFRNATDGRMIRLVHGGCMAGDQAQRREGLLM